MGEERFAPGGVLDHGTQEEDGPGTWEALVLLDNTRSHGESGDPFSYVGAQADPRGHDRATTDPLGPVQVTYSRVIGRRRSCSRADTRGVPENPGLFRLPAEQTL